MARERRRSIIFTIMKVSVIPVIILGIIMTAYSQESVREGMSYEVERSLSGIAHNVISMYNIIDPGEFFYSGGKFLKGETELTSDYRLLDDIKNDTGADVTIFYGKMRCLTTLLDEEGNRLVGTEASSAVIETVLHNGEEYFSEDVTINNVPYFGYYVPIRNDKNEVIGISFAGKSTEMVQTSIRYMMEGNVVICILVILLAAFICYFAANKMVFAIRHIKEYLERVAHGDFSCQMSGQVLRRRDELAEMGEYAVSVSRSLDDMVSRDPLTGLLNRRACIVQAEHRNGCSYAVAMGDIDFFKKVNDTYGHEMGDVVLKSMAKKMLSAVSSNGFVSRWGGEEFLFGYDGSDMELRECLEGVKKDIQSEVFDCGGDQFRVSMTFGITMCREGEDFDEIVKRADELLYYGKEHGRDQIVMEGQI